jgi:hypothetical protein
MWVAKYIFYIICHILEARMLLKYKYIYKHAENLRNQYQKFLLTLKFYITNTKYTRYHYFRDRRTYACLLFNFWKKIYKYKHILRKHDQFVFKNLMLFFIKYWSRCDLYRAFRSFLIPTYKVTNGEILYYFKDFEIFSVNYIKIFNRMHREPEYELKNGYYRVIPKIFKKY